MPSSTTLYALGIDDTRADTSAENEDDSIVQSIPMLTNANHTIPTSQGVNTKMTFVHEPKLSTPLKGKESKGLYLLQFNISNTSSVFEV